MVLVLFTILTRKKNQTYRVFKTLQVLKINNLDPRVRGMLPKKYFLFRGKPRGIKPSMRE
ncbi:MAG: hypothetical protein COC08_06465 [Maribacter sp.]|nr:MAG: hypothetical protein COC08_06465 [Maribacter sp.]